MLKKVAILIITCLFAVTAFAGCSVIAEQQEKSLIEDALQKRYGEEFVCMRTWNNAAGGYYDDSFYGLCHPKDDENLLFEILLNGDGSIRGDDYGSTIISRRFADIFNEQIGTRLGKHYTYCYNYGDLNDDVTGQKIANDEFAFDYYFSQLLATHESNQLNLYFTVCIDVSEQPNITYQEEYNLITSTLEQIYTIGATYDMDLQLLIDLFFVTDDTYSKCINYFNSNAQLKSDFYDLIEGYLRYPNPQKVILLNYEEGQYSLTEHEYVAQRKKLN